MTVSYEEAVRQVTAPGQPLEIVEQDLEGITYRVFRNVPPSLRELLGSARSRGDATFIVYEDERWSFAEIMNSVDALAALLVDRYGIRKGDRVAIAMRNLPEWVISFAAIVSIGAISVSLNAWWTEDEFDYAITDCGASLLIADRERVDRCAGIAGRLGIPVLAVRDDRQREGVDHLDQLLVPGTAMPDVNVQPGDDATILYTSGTTGRPKGAVSTHRAVIQALMGFGCGAAIQGVRRDPEPEGSPTRVEGSATSAEDPLVFILIVPLFHVTGCVPVMLTSFAVGLKLVMMYKWDPEVALQLIERERVTNFVGVPTQSWDLLESPRFDEFDTSSLRSIGGGGAPAPPTLVHRVDSRFPAGRPQIGYGMTETNAYGPGNYGNDYVTRPTSTGRATPILQVEVRDENDAPVPTGERGEIWFKGPNLIRGYWGNPEATAATIVDGWLRTGDIGRVDAEGFVYVEDRAKDMVLRAGENIYSAEVEAAIYEHESVYEAAVFGVPDERLGEQVAAVIHLKPGTSLTDDELQRHVRERIAAFKVPTHITFTDDRLPRNPSGKILKRQLRDSVAG